MPRSIGMGPDARPDGAATTRHAAESRRDSLSSRALVLVGAWRALPLIWRLGIAVAVVLGSVALRIALLGDMDERFAYVALYPAVAVAAIVGGLSAGVLATVVSAMFACFLFAPLHDAADWLALATFVVGASIIVSFAELLQAAQARLAAAERARQNEQYLYLFIDQAPVAIAMFDRSMRYVSVSARWKLDYRIDEEVIGRSHYDVFPEISQHWREVHRRGLAGEVVRADEDPFTRLDGSMQWLRWEVRPWYRARNDIGGIIIFSEDITDRKRAEASLRASEAGMRAIVDTALEAIVVIDEGGAVQSVNSATQDIFGYSAHEMVGRNITMLMPEKHAQYHDSYLEAYRNTGIRKIIGIGREVEGRRKDGSTFPLDLTVGEWRDAQGRRFFTGSMRDISARKHAQEALARSGRLEAVGKLAGGIAHDFNNLLAVISGNLELAELGIADERIRLLIRKALDATERGASFNRRLLSFARRRPLDPQRLLLNSRVTEMMELLERSLGEQIALTVDLAPNLWPSHADPGEVDSALTNLVINARDAMPLGGKLTITTRNVTLDDHAAEMEPDARPGDYVLLCLADTGEGMTPAVLQHAMEPFFTTKEPGKGTGLGLSSVFGFARQSGGFLNLASEVGKGTTVRLFLPRAVAEPVAAATPAGEAVRGQGESILVVEDDDHLREVTRQRLETLGYVVREARSAPEAIEHLRSGESIALVFSDVVMPGGMSGYDLARWIRKNMPQVKVLLTSGYNSKDERPREPAGMKTLDKPYTLAKLARCISEALSPAAG